jgi:hypothetical protein
MTGKADFTPEEWETVLHGPPTAGMIVLTAQRGGTFRETFAMARSYTDARAQHGQSELLDEITSHKPSLDRTHYHSPEELKTAGLQHLREAVALLGQKGTPEETEAYRGFVLSLAQAVAGAHREHGTNISPDEQTALDEIKEAVAPASAPSE